MDVDILSDETDETRVNDERKNTSDKLNVKVPSPDTKTSKEETSNRNDDMICKKEDGDTIGTPHAADPGKQMASQAIAEPIHKNKIRQDKTKESADTEEHAHASASPDKAPLTTEEGEEIQKQFLQDFQSNMDEFSLVMTMKIKYKKE